MLEKMTVAQLKEEAARLGVRVKTGSRKDEYVQAIKAAQNVVEAEVVEEPVDEEAGLKITFAAGQLEANFSALEERVDAILAQYEGWEPSADSADDVKQCERERRYLNAIANELDSRRKTVKAQYLAPLNEFEAKANGIRDKIKGVSARIDGVVKEAKTAEQERKRQLLQAHYEEFAEFLAPVVPYERVHDPRWLNKSLSLPKCLDELEDKVGEIAAQWESLKALGLEFYDAAEAHFFRTLDLTQAVAYNAKLVEDRRRIEEMKANIEAYAEPEPEGFGAPATALEPAQDAAPNEAPQPARSEPCTPACEPAPRMYQPPAAPPMAPQAEQPRPCVMVIGAATTEQMKAIGRFCGSLTPPVTGVFKMGTLEEAYRRETNRREAGYGRIG